MKTALIIGVTGQDGSLLSKHLLNLGYRVVGTSRDSQTCDVSRLKRLDVLNRISIKSLAINDFKNMLEVLKHICPDEVYNLAGQTSVSLSFKQPVECIESINLGTLILLEALKHTNKSGIKVFNAGSVEAFGDTKGLIANESSSLNPCSPYGVAKASSYWLVNTYRKSFNLFCCTGILSNHESPLRSDRFVTQKIIRSIKLIKAGQLKALKLGNIDISRDWGWAPDYVKAMHLMLQQNEPKDFIIASGKTSTLREFVRIGFEHEGLDFQDFLQQDTNLLRPCDISYSAVSPARINTELNWSSSYTLEEIIDKLFKDELD